MTFDEILQRLEHVRRAGDKATARCPAHRDSENSLSIAPGDKGVILKCFAGDTVEAVCAALGIEVHDLFYEKPAKPKRGAKKPEEPAKPITLAELAAAKQLPVKFLTELGVEDFPDGSGVGIPYYLENQQQAPRLRKRTALRAKDGSLWVGPSGVGVVPYGLWRLDEWRRGQ